jgi:DNA (cytosine-5)-methyltransferase 1
MSLQLVSLFAGVGGFDVAARNLGIPTVAAVEIDNAARGVLAHRFPDATLFDDVRNVTADDLRNAGAVPERTILVGGFPCQPFSVAGHRKGLDDERGDLYFEISRLLADFAPAWVVLENVPGLLSIDDGATFSTILHDLGQRGYGFCYRVLDAQYFGVPQRRRRVFIVGRLGDDRGPVQVLLEPEGGERDSAAGDTSGPDAASGSARGVDEPRIVGTLTGGGARGFRTSADDAANGLLIPTAGGGRVD